MATPESKVKAAVVKLLEKYDAYYFYPATHGYGRSGVPDIVCCVRGRFIGIECKAGDNKPTALQTRELDNIRRAGGIAVVINEVNLELLETILQERTGEKR
jgi:Holliday junction resolvase